AGRSAGRKKDFERGCRRVMAKVEFFPVALTPTVADIAQWIGAETVAGADLPSPIRGVAPINRAGPGDLPFPPNAPYAATPAKTRASAALLQPRYRASAPEGCAALAVVQPYRAFAEVLARLFPSAARPESTFGEVGVSLRASVHPSARLEAGVIVDPGA